MEIKERTERGGLVLELRGRLDGETASGLLSQLDLAIQGGTKKVILDLGGLDYLSAAGLAALVDSAAALERQAGQMALARPAGYAREVLDSTGYSSVLTLARNVDEAWEQLG